MSWSWRDTSGAVGPGTGTVANHAWYGAAINAEGTRIVGAARSDTGLWIGDLSSNGSWTWRDTSGSAVTGAGTGTVADRSWWGVAINAEGTRIVGAASNDVGLWIGDLSSNGSWTWRDTSGSAATGAGTGTGFPGWYGAAINDNGTRIVGAASNDVGLWIGDLSSNGSWTWRDTSGAIGVGTGTEVHNWQDVAINAAGTRIVGAANNDIGLWIGDLSSNGSWIWRDTSGSAATGAGTGTAAHTWYGVAINDEGTRIVGAAYGDTGLWIGDLSSNGSWTWRDTSGSAETGAGTGTEDRYWQGVAINGAGTRIVGCDAYDYSSLWIGDLSNGSWIWRDTSGSAATGAGTGINVEHGWRGAAINAKGTRIVGAAFNDTGLWIGDYTSPSPQPSSQSLPPSWSYIIGPGRASSELTRFQVGFNIRKPRSSQLDYDFRILQQMSAAQERRFD